MKEFPYKPKLWVMLCCVAFFGLCGVSMTYAAFTNDRGVIINRTIDLDTQGATVFYALIAAGGYVFVAAAILTIFLSLRYDRRVSFSGDSISVPKAGLSGSHVSIPYDQIRGLRVYTINRQTFLEISHMGGKHTLAAQCFSNKASFDECCRLLTSVVGGTP